MFFCSANDISFAQENENESNEEDEEEQDFNDIDEGEGIAEEGEDDDEETVVKTESFDSLDKFMRRHIEDICDAIEEDKTIQSIIERQNTPVQPAVRPPQEPKTPQVIFLKTYTF